MINDEGAKNLLWCYVMIAWLSTDLRVNVNKIFYSEHFS